LRNATGPILLVEDDPVDAMTMCRAFRSAGIAHPLQVVQNGKEALAYLRGADRYATGGSVPRPHLILMDLNMPLMSGHELLLILKRDLELRRIPVVIVSTSDREKDVGLAYDLGAAGYVVKPLEFVRFVSAVETICRYWRLTEIAAPS
jgi:CheY-like chemotaxis protein